MESEKVKEIKKRLEYCQTIKFDLLGEALIIINELESENKSLQDLCNKTYEDLTKENERLKNCIAELERKVYAKEDYYNAVKDRALEVFANKLKEKAIKLGWQGLGTTDIDETLKECLGK